MTFEKRMKNRIDSTLDEMVPNPYPKKKSFPLWAKIVVPVGGVALASLIAVAAIVPNLGSSVNRDFFIAAPKADRIKTLDSGLNLRTAQNALEGLDSYFANPSNKNYVLSPASYMLAASSLAAVSDGFDLAAFGFGDPASDTKAFLEAWNFLFEDDDVYYPAYCRFDSGVLHQQVGGRYRFDEKKRSQIVDDYIATSVASLRDYHAQATDYFHNAVDLSIPIPDPQLREDAVITYGALKMKDYVPNGFGISQREFHIGEKTIQVDARRFGSKFYPEFVRYYEGANYQAFKLPIKNTDLLIVLPHDGVALESVSVSKAYASYASGSKVVASVGYVPYFHVKTLSADITGAMARNLTGKERFYSKLLAGDVDNDLKLSSVLQASDFEFNQYGVAGESITVMTMVGSAEPQEHQVIELNVDRPFYALSLKDGFPLFVNKVVDPSK